MKYIAHRGNINGPNPLENHPDYIKKALELGYDVEIDVWLIDNHSSSIGAGVTGGRFVEPNIDNKLFLGHDGPQYEITIDFLKNNGLWCHAKNLNALYLMLENDIHCFWHQNDDFTITSRGFIWSYPGKELTNNSICLMPEWNNSEIDENCYAVCSDFVFKYRSENK